MHISIFSFSCDVLVFQKAVFGTSMFLNILEKFQAYCSKCKLLNKCLLGLELA